MRVEFLCGGRALRELRHARGLVDRLARSLTVGPEEIEATVARLREAEESARKRLEIATERLIGYESQDLVARAERVGQLPVVRLVVEGRTLEEVRALARSIGERGGVALLGIRGEKAQVIFARGPGVSIDCGALLREVVGRFGGRGGGQAQMAQGGLPDAAKLEEALKVAWEVLEGAK